jgi:hypothetical protein
MTDKLKQVVKREVAKLPKENQEVINAFGWEQISEEIGKKYLFSEIELNDLQVHTLLVLLGLTDPESYAFNIENNIGTSKDESRKITDDVFRKIFIPINDILIENIKKSDKVKNPKPEQTLDFILSGGDYSAFMTPNSPLEEYPAGGGGQNYPPRPSSTPEEGNKSNIPIKPGKMDDIKSKLVI